MSKPKPFNWQQFKKYLEKDFGRRLPRDTFEVFKEKTFQRDYKKVAREFCSHCLEINYLLQLFGYEENLSEINLKTLIYGFEDYIIHTDINGYGRWTNKAEKLNPEDYQKIYLYKGIVLMEKYRQYGSASPAASVFMELEQRGLVTPELLDWTFKNRNCSYTPFRCSRYPLDVKSYDSFKRTYIEDEIRSEKHHERMDRDHELSQKLKIKRKVEHSVLMVRRKIRNQNNIEKLNNYLKEEPDVLQDILNKNLDFPIYILPNNIIDKIIPKIDELSLKDLKKVFNLIPRKANLKLLVLKRKAGSKLKSGLSGFMSSIIIRTARYKKIKRKNDENKKNWINFYKRIRGEKRRQKILNRKAKMQSVLSI